MLRAGKEQSWLGVLQNTTAIQEHQIVAYLSRKTHFVGHKQHGGFIEKHHVGLHAQCASDSDPLLLSAGELIRVFTRLIRDPDLVEVMHGTVHSLLFPNASNFARRQGAVFQYAQMRKQVELLEHHADSGTNVLHRRAVMVDLLAMYAY